MERNKLNDIPDFSLENLEYISVKSSKKTYQAFVIGICGPANCGKTYISENLKDHLRKKGFSCCILKEKNFFKQINKTFSSEEERTLFMGNYDFDSVNRLCNRFRLYKVHILG